MHVACMFYEQCTHLICRFHHVHEGSLSVHRYLIPSSKYSVRKYDKQKMKSHPMSTVVKCYRYRSQSSNWDRDFNSQYTYALFKRKQQNLNEKRVLELLV